MLKRKKILFLITKSNFGGAQRYVFDLACALPKDTFDVVVVCGGNGVLVEKLAQANVRTVCVKALQRDISMRKEFDSFRNLLRIIRSEQPDVLHVNSSKAGGMGALAGRMCKVPNIVYTSHGWAFNEDRGLVSKLLVGFLHWLTILLSHQTICVSEGLRAQMRWPVVRKKMVVIHNGRAPFDTYSRSEARLQLCKELSEEFDLKAYQKDIWGVTVAELHPIKRHETTIAALANIIKEHPHYRHVLIGEDTSPDKRYRQKLMRLVHSFKLQQHVFFAGNVHEAARFLKAFDLFVLASKSEALAYVVIEACQAGLPIVATKVGGIPEIVTDQKDGILVPPNNPFALGKAIRLLLDDTKMRNALAKAALEKGQYFTLERMVYETIVVYEKR